MKKDSPKVYRPWGYYQEITVTSRRKVKYVKLRPGAATSLQYHNHRSEHWSIKSGFAKVIKGDKEFLLKSHDSIIIDKGEIHRIENISSKIDLEFIEIQHGNYLGEDDIIRLADKYNRVENCIVITHLGINKPGQTS